MMTSPEVSGLFSLVGACPDHSGLAEKIVPTFRGQSMPFLGWS